jgi:hypothetical protein
MSEALVLEYVNDLRVYASQQSFEVSAWSNARRQHYRAAVLWTIVLIVGCYAAIRAELVPVLFGFAVLLIAHVATAFPYSRIQRRSIEAATKDLPTKHVRLVVDAEGLHETTEGISSFAPWPSVQAFSVFEDVLFIELKARLWALIPHYGLQPGSASVEKLVERLRAQGIRERSRSDVA